MNGDTLVYFNGSSTAVRLAGQFDASSYATGIYTLGVTITASYAGSGPVSHSYSRSLAIVNEAASPVARGWTIAGVQRIYFSGGAYLITEGTGNAIIFTALGVPVVDYSILTYNAGTTTYTRTYLDGSTVTFNASGFMTAFTDRLGLVTTYRCDTSNRLNTIVDPARNNLGSSTAPYITLVYNTTYGLNAIQERGGPGGPGRGTGVTIAADSSLHFITDPDLVHTTYTYDANRRLSTVVNRRGDTTTYVYDTHSWKAKEMDLPRIPVDIGGGSTSNIIPKVKFTPWQTLGVPTSPTSSSTPATPIAKNAVIASVTDPIGRITTMTVDRWGQPLVVTNPANQVTTITRSGMLPIQIAHPTGGTDTLLYVSGTPLVSYVHMAGDSAINYQYGAQNQIDSVWGPGRDAEYRFLDATTGRVDAIRYSGTPLLTAFFYYDSYNRLTKYTDPGTHLTTYTYDNVFGNVDTVTRQGSRSTRYQFDAFGRTIGTQTSGMPVQQQTQYDTLDRVVKQYHSGLDTTSIVYDAMLPTRVQAPGGQFHKFTTNALGWLTQRYDSKDTTALFISYRYDTVGRLTSYTNRRGGRVDLTYDALDRLTTLVHSSTPAIVVDSFAYSYTDPVKSCTGVIPLN